MTVDDVLQKVSNAAANYAVDYMSAMRRGEHLGEGLDRRLEPILTEILNACRFDEHKKHCLYCNQGAVGCDRGRELIGDYAEPDGLPDNPDHYGLERGQKR